MKIARVFVVNASVRVVSAALGQVFAFVLAERVGAAADGRGAYVVAGLSALYFGTELVASPLAGRVVDTKGPGAVLRLAAPLLFVACLLGAVATLAHDALLFVGLALARVLEGAAAACATPSALASLNAASRAQPQERQRLLGLFELSSLVALLSGYVVAGLAWDGLARGTFLVLAALVFPAWFAARGARVVSSPPRAAQRPGALVVLQRLGARPGARAFVLGWLAMNASVGAWMHGAPYLLKLPLRSESQRYVGGFSASEVSGIFLVWGLVLAAGLVLWSTVGRAVPRRSAMAVGALAMGLVALLLGAGNHGAGPWVLAVACVAIVVEAGYTPAAFAKLGDLAESCEGAEGAVLGLSTFLLGAGQLVGAAIAGPVVGRWHMDGLLGLTVVLAGAAFVSTVRTRHLA